MNISSTPPLCSLVELNATPSQGTLVSSLRTVLEVDSTFAMVNSSRTVDSCITVAQYSSHRTISIVVATSNNPLTSCLILPTLSRRFISVCFVYKTLRVFCLFCLRVYWRVHKMAISTASVVILLGIIAAAQAGCTNSWDEILSGIS